MNLLLLGAIRNGLVSYRSIFPAFLERHGRSLFSFLCGLLSFRRIESSCARIDIEPPCQSLNAPLFSWAVAKK